MHKYFVRNNHTAVAQVILTKHSTRQNLDGPRGVNLQRFSLKPSQPAVTVFLGETFRTESISAFWVNLPPERPSYRTGVAAVIP